MKTLLAAFGTFAIILTVVAYVWLKGVAYGASAERQTNGATEAEAWTAGANHAHDKLLKVIESVCQGNGNLVVEDRHYICTPAQNLRL